LRESTPDAQNGPGVICVNLRTIVPISQANPALICGHYQHAHPEGVRRSAQGIEGAGPPQVAIGPGTGRNPRKARFLRLCRKNAPKFLKIFVMLHCLIHEPQISTDYRKFFQNSTIEFTACIWGWSFAKSAKLQK
jgi:hypothetical protein